MTLEDEYDEEADSDFSMGASDAEDLSASSGDDASNTPDAPHRPRKRRKLEKSQAMAITELDSGDETTILEQKNTRRRDKGAEAAAANEDINVSEGWRARTRAMRVQEKEARRRNKLVSSKESTIDVNKVWEEMNRPEPLPPPHIESESHNQNNQEEDAPNSRSFQAPRVWRKESEKENLPVIDRAETITIKRRYKFAGEVHVEEKSVPRSSAEAQLWLAQQQPSKGPSPADGGNSVNRPLRKISRFDPNFSNLDAFKGAWTDKHAEEAKFKGPKLNVVEKSKMDWAVHVDTEGLKDELDTHAKAKEGYLTKMDFLRDVEYRKEAEAKAARLRGR